MFVLKELFNKTTAIVLFIPICSNIFCKSFYASRPQNEENSGTDKPAGFRMKDRGNELSQFVICKCPTGPPALPGTSTSFNFQPKVACTICMKFYVQHKLQNTCVEQLHSFWLSYVVRKVLRGFPPGHATFPGNI